MINPVFAFEGLDKAGDDVSMNGADANTIAPARMTGWAGFGIDGIDHVIVSDEQAADAAEVVTGFEVIAVLVINLDAMIATVSYPQATQ